MHFDPFLSVLEQKNLRFTTMDLLSYPLDFCSALLSVDGAPLVLAIIWRPEKLKFLFFGSKSLSETLNLTAVCFQNNKRIKEMPNFASRLRNASNSVCFFDKRVHSKGGRLK